MGEPNWIETPARLYILLKDAGAPSLALRRALFTLPVGERSQIDRLYYHPYEKYAHAVLYGDGPFWDGVESSLGGVCPVVLTDGAPPSGYGEEPWVLVKAGVGALQRPAEVMNVLPNPVNRLWGGPSPLAATLTGGVLGAGLGYGAGWLGEQVLPEEYFEKGRLRKAMAMLGGAAGMVPGAAWGLGSYAHHPETPGVRALVSGWPFRDQDYSEPAAKPAEKLEHPYVDPPEPPNPIRLKKRSLDEACAALLEAAGMEKFSFDNFAGGLGGPPIEVDAFNRVVWQDPRTPMDIRAATTGLTESASVLRGGAETVSVADVGRIAVGMGTGWASGLLVGKTLGALAGLRPEAQKSLQQAGTWAGVLANVIPMAFRRS